VQFPFIGAPKARCSPERRMCETLLLANPDIDTLRHQCSRASTSCQETCSASRIFAASFPGWLAKWFVMRTNSVEGCPRIARGALWTVSVTDGETSCRETCSVTRIFAASFPGWLAKWFVMRTNSAEGCPRIARGALWAGSVTGGEARQNPCSEKEGFTHPSLWRAPCFWGTYE